MAVNLTYWAETLAGGSDLLGSVPSGLVPILLVFAFFSILFGGAVFFMLRSFRGASVPPGTISKAAPSAEEKRLAKWRKNYGIHQSADSAIAEAPPAELGIEGISAEARALAQVSDLEKKLKIVMAEIEQLYLANAHALAEIGAEKDKAQAQALQNEHQLQDFLKHLEQLFKSGDVEGLTPWVSPAPAAALVVEGSAELDKYRAICEEQAHQLDRMRELLKGAKKQILRLSGQASNKL